MATILFSAAAADPSLVANFDAVNDQLLIDSDDVAATFRVVGDDNNVTFTNPAGVSVTLPIAITAITPTNILIPGGSAFLVGDLQADNVTDNLTNLINVHTLQSGEFIGEGIYVAGLGGNDSITSSSGSEVIYGNQGNDSVQPDGAVVATPGVDTVFGGQDDDVLNYVSVTGNFGAVLYGNKGDDDIDGTAGAAADLLYGGQGDDTITGNGTGADIFYGNIGNDLITGTGGNNELWGGADNDTLSGANGNDTFVAGSGADSIVAGTDSDIVYGNQGNDTIGTGDGENTVFGGQDADTITGGANEDLLYGNKGADTLNGAGGNDSLYGGADDDALYGGAASDFLVGGLGADTLDSGVDAGADTLIGGEGADIFRLGAIATAAAGADDDVITDFASGDGIVLLGTQTAADIFTNTFDDGDSLTGVNATDADRLAVIDGSDLVLKDDSVGQLTLENAAAVQLNGTNLDLGAGNGQLYVNILGTADTFTGGDDADRLVGSEQGDTLSGGGGADIIWGATSGDVLNGDAGNDTINGFAGDDVLSGGAGTDVLVGGVGADTFIGEADVGNTLLGGEGSDVFDFTGAGAVVGAGGTEDTITGGAGIDVIRLSTDGGATDQFDGITEVESIVLTNDDAFQAILIDGNVAATESLTIDGSALSGTNTLDIDGSAEADGSLILLGGSGVDDLTGGDLADTLNGGAGDDSVLAGGAGNDVIDAGAGDDSITGGADADTLTGGVGDDVFIYTTATDSSAADGDISDLDVITDFNFGTGAGAGAVDQIDTVALGTFAFLGTVDIASVDVANVATAINGAAGFNSASTNAEAVLINIQGGELGGTSHIAIDTDDDGAFETLINVTGFSGTVDASDFI